MFLEGTPKFEMKNDGGDDTSSLPKLPDEMRRDFISIQDFGKLCSHEDSLPPPRLPPSSQEDLAKPLLQQLFPKASSRQLEQCLQFFTNGDVDDGDSAWNSDIKYDPSTMAMVAERTRQRIDMAEALAAVCVQMYGDKPCFTLDFECEDATKTLYPSHKWRGRRFS
jgi:hypothetical protein